jgi:hypothetical protein
MQTVNRENVADFMAEALARAEADPDSSRLRLSAAPAGIPLDIFSNCDELIGIYEARLRSSASDPSIAPYRIYAVSAHHHGAEDVAVWTDETCSPQEFHRILAERGLRAAYPYRRNVWQFLDVRRRIGMQLVGAVADLPPWDSGAPLRQHLHWILQAHGLRLTHASTLGRSGIGVVFFGNSGAGKSGIALAGLSIGLQTIGDDYLALSNGNRIRGLSLFNIIKQDRRGLARVPEIEARSATLPENWKGKVEIDPTWLYPDAFVSELEIRTALVPRITGADAPSLTDCGQGLAMRALMRSNLHQFPGEDDEGMRFFGSLLRRLPVFSLELSRDFRKNGELVASLLDTL